MFLHARGKLTASLAHIGKGGGLSTSVLGIWEWSQSQSRFGEVEWVAIAVKEPTHIWFPLPMSPIIAAMCVNHAKMSIGTTFFVASWVVAAEMGLNAGVRRMF